MEGIGYRIVNHKTNVLILGLRRLLTCEFFSQVFLCNKGPQFSKMPFAKLCVFFVLSAVPKVLLQSSRSGRKFSQR